jgi:hypothetical protein
VQGTANKEVTTAENSIFYTETVVLYTPLGYYQFTTFIDAYNIRYYLFPYTCKEYISPAVASAQVTNTLGHILLVCFCSQFSHDSVASSLISSQSILIAAPNTTLLNTTPRPKLRLQKTPRSLETNQKYLYEISKKKNRMHTYWHQEKPKKMLNLQKKTPIS